MPQKVNFIPNDPDAAGAPLLSVEYKTAKLKQKWHVTAAPTKISVAKRGTLQFQNGQIDMTLSSCISMWSSLLDKFFQKWQSTSDLPVIPRQDYRTFPGAKDGLNAVYTRDELVFFFDTDTRTGKDIFSCESLEIVSHEAGHAVLDAVHPEFWNPSYPEINAFHEAFADCSSILTTLQQESVRQAFVKMYKSSNLVSCLAEEMGQAIYNRYPTASFKNCLRDAINKFVYHDPTKLPDRGRVSTLTRGSHSFSRVFVGTFYLCLVNIYEILEKGKSSKDSALQEAADSLGKIFSEAVISTFGTELFYREIALSMVKADQKLFAGKFRRAILDAFIQKKILSSAGVRSLEKSSSFHSATGAAKPLSDLALPMNLKGHTGVQLAKKASGFLGFANPEKVGVQVERDPHTDLTLIRGEYSEILTLDGADYGLPGEVNLFLPSGFAMFVGEVRGRSKLVASHAHVTSQSGRQEAENQLDYLARTEKIYVLESGERVDKVKLAAKRKPYYYELKSRRLLRAYYA